jgi:hypothetical protein
MLVSVGSLSHRPFPNKTPPHSTRMTAGSSLGVGNPTVWDVQIQPKYNPDLSLLSALSAY